MHKLGAQYENHSYVKELTNQCNVVFIYGTYVVDDIRKLVFNWDKEIIAGYVRSFT